MRSGCRSEKKWSVSRTSLRENREFSSAPALEASRAVAPSPHRTPKPRRQRKFPSARWLSTLSTEKRLRGSADVSMTDIRRAAVQQSLGRLPLTHPLALLGEQDEHGSKHGSIAGL